MSPVLIIGAVVVVLIVIIAVVSMSGSSTPAPVPVVTPSGQVVGSAVPPASVATPTVAQRVYNFIQGQDSGGNDIRQDAANANNLAALKASCDAAPGCIAFNTNGWLKNKLNPKSAWYTWTSDPAKGMYILQGTPTP